MAEMIKFYKGALGSLPTTGVNGAIYITTDEGGIYLGTGTGMKRLGDFIQVDSVSSLPVSGANTSALYYCVAENVLCRFDAGSNEWVQINKQKTLAQLGGVSLEAYNTKIAALEKADSDNATAIANLDKKVGTIPNGEDGQPVAESVIAYINKKTDGIATSGNLEALGARVGTVEDEIDALQEALAAGGETSKAIGDAQAAADAAQDAVDTLAGKVGEVAEGKTVAGLIGEAQAQADKGVADAATAQAKADSAYTLAEGRATIEQVNSAIANAGHAVKADVDQAIADLDAAYKKADGDLKSELEGKINAKVAQSDYDAKVAELAGADTTLQGNIDALAGKVGEVPADKTVVQMIADAQTAATYDDTKVKEDIKANADDIAAIKEDYLTSVEEKALQDQITANANAIELLTNGVSADEVDGVNDLINYVKEHGPEVLAMQEDIAENAKAIADQATSDAATYETKTDAAQKLTDAKAYTDTEVGKLAQADTDNLAAAKKYTDDEIAELNIAQYAKQADVDTAIANVNTEAANKDAVVLAEAQKGINAVQTNLDEHEADAVAHITAAERTAWNAAEQNAKDFATGLNNAMDARVDALEAIDHEHANKAELDKIADGDVAKWNGAQAAAEATAAAALAGAKTELEGKITAEETRAKVAEKANADAIGIINGADTVDGSIAKALKDAKAYADTAESDAVTTANAYTDSALTWGSF